MEGIPEVSQNANIGELIISTASKQNLKIENGDIIIVTHKIVSKAEGSTSIINEVNPSPFAYKLAKKMGKDPRILEIILNETNRIVKMRGRHLIVEHKYGHICANAGVDRSNVKSNRMVLLPRNSDKSANQIRESVKKVTNNDVAIIITDTSGRPFRKGQVNIAIGISGLKPIKNYIGIKDRYDQRLRSTMIAVADELASAAELVMGKIDNIPIAIVKGYQYSSSNETAKELIRDSSRDLFA